MTENNTSDDDPLGGLFADEDDRSREIEVNEDIAIDTQEFHDRLRVMADASAALDVTIH